MQSLGDLHHTGHTPVVQPSCGSWFIVKISRSGRAGVQGTCGADMLDLLHSLRDPAWCLILMSMKTTD